MTVEYLTVEYGTVTIYGRVSDLPTPNNLILLQVNWLQRGQEALAKLAEADRAALSYKLPEKVGAVVLQAAIEGVRCRNIRAERFCVRRLESSMCTSEEAVVARRRQSRVHASHSWQRVHGFELSKGR